MSNQTRGIKKGDAMEAKPLGLNFVWKIRLKLWAEGNKLRAEGDKLWDAGDKLWAEGNKICAEGNKLRAEGDKLRAEGDKLWAESIIAAHGNIKLEWKNWHEDKQSCECWLETGEKFIP